MSTPASPCRVVITGLGLISPSGASPEELWANLSAGQTSIGPCTATAPDAGTLQVSAEASCFTGSIKDFGELESGLKKSIRKALKLMCRETQMAVAATQLALSDAKLGEGEHEPEKSGVVLGSDYMMSMPADIMDGVAKCTENGQFNFDRWGDEGLGEVEPLWMLRYLPNMPASHVAIFNDFRGPNNSLTMREASGMMAIGEAYRIIARGHAKRMVAGATGTKVMPLQAIHTMQAGKLAPPGDDPTTACRPFDKSRRGTVAGEGAATIMLESLESAEARGATIYGELRGYGASWVSDKQLIGKNDIAIASAMTTALREADIAPQDLGHINAHGLATKEDDIQEARAIQSVFGEAAASTPVTALKCYFGDLGAGGGVVELIGSLLALKNDALPRVLNFETPDPECPVAAVREDGVSPGDSFVTTTATPQGQAAALVVAKK